MFFVYLHSFQQEFFFENCGPHGDSNSNHQHADLLTTINTATKTENPFDDKQRVEI